MNHAVFDTATGKIKRFVSCPESQLLNQVQAGEGVLSTNIRDDRAYFVQESEVVERPQMQIRMSRTEIKANGRAKVVLRGIPKGAKMLILGPVSIVDQVDDGVAEITTDYEGTYMVELNLFPFQDWRGSFVAV